jgi:hypothetical protein
MTHGTWHTRRADTRGRDFRSPGSAHIGYAPTPYYTALCAVLCPALRSLPPACARRTPRTSWSWEAAARRRRQAVQTQHLTPARTAPAPQRTEPWSPWSSRAALVTHGLDGGHLARFAGASSGAASPTLRVSAPTLLRRKPSHDATRQSRCVPCHAAVSMRRWNRRVCLLGVLAHASPGSCVR